MGYTIWPDTRTGEVLSEVNQERIRQEELKRSGKFLFTCADTNYPIPSKLAVLAEEFGEVAKEVVELGISIDKYAKENLTLPAHRMQHYRAELRKELIQVAAVAVAWAESLDE